MPAVSNTSPLSNLAIIGRLELLAEQFGEIWIPEAVAAELDRLSAHSAQDRLQAARQAGWLRVQKLRDRT